MYIFLVRKEINKTRVEIIYICDLIIFVEIESSKAGGDISNFFVDQIACTSLKFIIYDYYDSCYHI